MGQAAPEAGARAIVLLSGGIDSAVALWWARERFDEVFALSFDYHLRPAREVTATEALADAAGVRELVRVPLPFLREAADAPSALLDNPALRKAPAGYVPARNLVFYSLAAYHAEVLGARVVVGGHHGTDARAFPDASPAFFAAFEKIAAKGVWSFREEPLRILLPLANLSKTEVLVLASRIGTPLDLTWSCYDDGDSPCGACPSCRERAAAFETLERADPAAVAGV